MTRATAKKTTPRRRKDPRPVRERILEAAVDLLRTGGVKALTQPRVAKQAGVEQGHLTYYFPRHVDLMAAVAHRFVEILGSELQSRLASKAFRDGEVDARRRVREIVAALVRDHERTRMLLALTVASAHDPALREVMTQQAASVRSVVAFALGRPESDQEVQLALAMLWGVGLVQLVWHDDRTDEETDAFVEAALSRIDSFVRE